MAESVSSCVKKIIDRTPFIQEMLIDGIISFSNYSASILEETTLLHGAPVKQAAIVMAVRRYADELRCKGAEKIPAKVDYEIVMKTNIFDINLVRRDSFISRLFLLYQDISTEKGDFINVALGTHEISLVVSEKYRDAVENLVEGEQILTRMDDLVSLTLVFSGDFLQTPGIIHEAVRRLAWENINMIEIISTMNELTFVLKREDSMKAFSVLQSFLGK
ncbi:hypothetical protein [Parasphaerochaeta coccoides]|uniref:Aspartate kinase n=1 Tax=Parasphaerochaeta coccoides (strain ATCC BAA-1237 / DSM 17374 / SPN1) TaxID=760011 RepID=F4GKZ2_PARC1|nr:hypothetical protein [Parasphaerochaeta coccoides]AEC01905.1 hypothetical protein Spico_0679 [Parasphaerochaeta coccoides DSM 17374]